MSHESASGSRFLDEKSVPLDTHAADTKSVRNVSGNLVDRDPTSPIVSADAPEKGAVQSSDIAIWPLLEETASTGARDSTAHEGAEKRPQIGSVVAERYVLLEKAGTSGMGIVYKAMDRHREAAGDPKPWVALKFPRSGGVSAADTTFSLRQEFLTLSGLRHPNIVAVYDLGREDGAEFLVLEWLTGETLASLLRHMGSARLALRMARDIVENVATALAYAHENGVVHGDVKPANIFITDEGAVKLIDFGASLHASGAACTTAGGQSWATRTYASCEILEGKPARPADDVFALGVTAYFLLSGDWPFGDLNALGARDQGILPPELPEDPFSTATPVHSALQFDIDQRPADAAEFLRIFLSDSDVPEPIVPAQFPHHLGMVRWGGLAALAVVLFIVWATREDVSSVTKVDRMLETAEEALSSGRLAEPVGNSALDQYQQVLTFEPDNPRALIGIDKISDEFLYRARSALKAEDFDEAVVNLQMARQLRPDRLGITLMEDLIRLFRRDLLMSARQAVENDAAGADDYLARAAALAPDSDPLLEELRRELEQQRADAEIESLMRAIDERILSEKLLVPKGDSAIDLLREARAGAADDYQVELAGNRIASALLFQGLFAISNGDLDRAQSFIDAAASLGIRHLALARAKYELAKARNALVQSQTTDRQR